MHTRLYNQVLQSSRDYFNLMSTISKNNVFRISTLGILSPLVITPWQVFHSSYIHSSWSVFFTNFPSEPTESTKESQIHLQSSFYSFHSLRQSPQTPDDIINFFKESTSYLDVYYSQPDRQMSQFPSDFANFLVSDPYYMQYVVSTGPLRGGNTIC